MTVEQKFFQLTGEHPIDVLGSDWRNYIDDFIDEEERNQFAENYS